MRDLGSVVQVWVRDMLYRRHRGAASRRLAPELFGHHLQGDSALSLQQLTEQALRRTSVSPPLNEDIKDVTVLVDRTPQVVAVTLNRDKYLVEVPGVDEAPLAPLRSASIYRPNLPQHCLMAVQETMTARWARMSSTSRRLRQKRW